LSDFPDALGAYLRAQDGGRDKAKPPLLVNTTIGTNSLPDGLNPPFCGVKFFYA
jgi:hypothetical protein